MPKLYSYKCAICRQIERSFSFTEAKCQISLVTHVPYMADMENSYLYLFKIPALRFIYIPFFSRHRDTLVIFVSNANNP